MLEEPDILANESQAAVWHTFANSSRKLSFTATIPESEDAMIQQAADPKQAILSSTNQRPPSSMKHSSLETRSIMSASSNPQGRTSQHHAHFAPNTTSAPLVPRGPHTSQIYPRPYPPIIRPPNNSTSQVNWANQPYNSHAMSNTESRPQSRIQSANYSQQPQHSQYIHPPRTPVDLER
ncbi:hypothetical protein BCR33DRAFT_580766 [Rhizoclosmatium globosum]|uniref:Uncharacterized protein n=1 Tax=Rhizoclosmatium globosum TaxID=329046 RepID=A0A1Y2CQN0_9FUNG|nr:hypothetical protein BCR33DRAFT_580766 [Rhizoclosmatium globosum]|eukprot:ORY49349.1 hypothetical protein BCR33DRAFT_580766 [Rhizoclosmatium globosum]